MTEPGARDRILAAAEELFADQGFDATPTSRIAERAGVPKGLVHYYFKRKPDLLTALVERLPEDRVDPAHVVVPGDVAASLRRLVDVLDRSLDSSAMLSHLLWREADTHPAVLDALRTRGCDYHELRTRRAGSRSFVDVHILVPGTMSVLEGHNLVEGLEKEVQLRLPHVEMLTHLEPIEDPRSWADETHRTSSER